MKMTVYAYLRKLVKSTSVILCLKLPRVLKFTLAGKEFHTTLTAKKPVASTVVAM